MTGDPEESVGRTESGNITRPASATLRWNLSQPGTDRGEKPFQQSSTTRLPERDRITAARD